MESAPVYALGGEPLSAPANTLVGYWAALGSGADGLAIGVRLTSDGVVVCTGDDSLEGTCGATRLVAQTNSRQLRALDAGAVFTSTGLDRNGRPTGKRGEDRPWVGGRQRPALYHPTLEEVLVLFSRRTGLMLMFPAMSDQAALERLTDATVGLLRGFGLLNRCTLVCPAPVCPHVKKKAKGAELFVLAHECGTAAARLKSARESGATGLVLDVEMICRARTSGAGLDPDFAAAWKAADGLKLLLTSSTAPYAVGGAYYRAAAGLPRLCGIVTGSVEYTRESATPRGLLLQDRFAGPDINRTLWAAGYSHANRETTIRQQNGLIIDISEGNSYSGAAAATVIPVHGRFDARVAFHVSNPHQGTTFEMAAIGIDPGYFRTDNAGLDSRSVNLTFDVHGAPPYASSERDEDDGFRGGWNNGYNLTRVADDWEASSVNMYNKYTRDVGYGGANSPAGHLRLVRNGSVFNTYYRDRFNPAWVCSGSMLVPNLGPDIFIRLAAKHWNKVNPAPANRVVFKDFRLYQW